MKQLGTALFCMLFVMGTVDATSSKATFSATNLFAFGDPSQPVPGAATLIRTDYGLELSMSVTGLTPGHVYTVWWIIFNNPRGCEHPIPGVSLCGGADQGGKHARSATLWAAGAIADEGGTAEFKAKLKRGALPKGLFVSPKGVGRLTRPHRAEVHVLGVRHPAATTLSPLGLVADALTTPVGILLAPKR